MTDINKSLTGGGGASAPGGTAGAHGAGGPTGAAGAPGRAPGSTGAAGTGGGGGAGVAVVTGAGSGIGRAVALALAAAGWSVTLAGRRAAALEETAALAGGAGERVAVVPADVTDPSSVTGLFTSVRDRFGRLDLLFNNAGTFGPAVPPDEIAYADWRSVVDVNLTGAFLCAQAAFRTMREQSPQGGRIINNGSVSAHVPRPHSLAYTATKHAVTGLTKSLSLDGRPHRIACGQIDVGNAATPMTAGMRAGVLQADGTTAAEPVMDAADVARTVLHMAGLPLEANVQFATVVATTMPYIGRG
ncbi:SDR family oxidoreductase [Streptomyces sp. TRM 70351]|uniref:SDR family oxidoreductase n=1 Tax=Streptomyces sp. TRM 70351 TaxID=3116552 RepID=UPI002E7AED45|nr:SDR family oxidoreductase [Streptomyces sp. TRM 70351]MEE1928581.1 SDR family oxidoreductase [Streptomyces sp. TRM 70351]